MTKNYAKVLSVFEKNGWDVEPIANEYILSLDLDNEKHVNSFFIQINSRLTPGEIKDLLNERLERMEAEEQVMHELKEGINTTINDLDKLARKLRDRAMER